MTSSTPVVLLSIVPDSGLVVVGDGAGGAGTTGVGTGDPGVGTELGTGAAVVVRVGLLATGDDPSGWITV